MNFPSISFSRIWYFASCQDFTRKFTITDISNITPKRDDTRENVDIMSQCSKNMLIVDCFMNDASMQEKVVMQAMF
jgi:hypothetical protein